MVPPTIIFVKAIDVVGLTQSVVILQSVLTPVIGPTS